ncbi:MAG: DNA polymerase I, partial [Actinomycetota bacterium]|nr:DNA polymerase I [Actinomycetota bacterium]
HEADDIISFLAKRAASEGIDVRIVTGDRDFFQLVNNDIQVLYNRRGITDIVEMDRKAVEKRYGVPPTKYVDLKALEGDSSDNLPGVPGVGTKTAAKLVQRYGSAEKAIAHADEQTPKLAANLASHAEQVVLNKKLSTLAEVPLEVEISDLVMKPWDMGAVKELFTSLEFRSLLERLLSDLPEAAEGEGTPFELEMRVASSADQLAELAAELRASDGIALDVSAPAPRKPPRSIALAWGQDKAAFVPLDQAGASLEELAQALLPVLSDASIPKLAHGARTVLLSLRAAGIDVSGMSSDVEIGAYLLDPGGQPFELDGLARKYAGRALRTTDEEPPRVGEGTQLALEHEADDEARARASCLRARAVFEVSVALHQELDRLGMAALYRDIEHPLIEVLAAMEQAGVRIDLDYLGTMAQELDVRIEKLEDECYALAGERLNLGSPAQLRTLLYEKLGLTTRRRTKTGLSTDVRALQTLVEEHPFVPKLLEYRELAKLKNTYVDALPPLVDPEDGRLHTNYDQTATTTGRLSSTNPNLQNIPVRTEIGKRIRRAFIPEPGCLLLSADYSQIELRVMAHLSEDEILLDVFASGEDIHAETAARIFSVERPALTNRHRSVAKMVNYGLSYGMGAAGLAERLNVPVAEAQDVIDAYLAQFSGVSGFLEQVVAHAHADGFTTTMFGRRRYLPELGSGNPRVRAIGERQALNAPIQGSAADIMKLAMIAVERALEERVPGARMILTVHDELVFEVEEGREQEVAELVERAMTGVCDMKVPLAVDLSWGPTWSDAKS